MNKSHFTWAVRAAVAALFAYASAAPAEADESVQRGWRAGKRVGQYGKVGAIGGPIRGGNAGAIAGSWAGPKGGTFRGAKAGFWKRGKGGAGGGAFQATGPNGGTGQGAAGGAWRVGEGGKAFSKSNWVGPNGNTLNGYKNAGYNAQSGEGYYDSGKSGTYKGKDYGYSQETDYTKGQGGTTTVDSLNKQDYQIEWQKGTKPVVTPLPATTQ